MQGPTKNRRRKRVHGFRARSQSVLKNRRQKGRHALSV